MKHLYQWKAVLIVAESRNHAFKILAKRYLPDELVDAMSTSELDGDESLIAELGENAVDYLHRVDGEEGIQVPLYAIQNSAFPDKNLDTLNDIEDFSEIILEVTGPASWFAANLPVGWSYDQETCL